MKRSTQKLMSGISAAVMSLTAVSAADVAVMGSAVSAFAAEGVAVNETNFPDENFRNYVSENIDLDGNGVLSDSEIEAVDSLFVVNKNIANLKGVEFFTALTDLDCDSNQLTSLDVSNNTKLVYLDCNSNLLTSINISKCTTLFYLSCYDNQLTSIDTRDNANLEYLICQFNLLTSLDISKNTKLTRLLCNSNQLTYLDVSKNTAVFLFDCSSNQLTSLDVSKNTKLESLECGSNQLTSIDVSKNNMLTYIDCAQNEFDLKTSSLNELTKYGFDGAKASNWHGATYDAKTNSLKNITSDTVTYDYDAGNGFTAKFTLNTDGIAKADPTKPVVTAEPTYGGAEVTWETVDGAINYRVFTYIPGQKIRQFGSDTKGTSMTVKGLNGGQKTGIIVLAQFANKKWSTYTEDDIAYVTPLDAVKPYLCVNPKGDGNYYLIWSSVPTSVRYKVMAREKGTDNWELIGATRQRCRITVQLDPNKEYEFLVRGLNSRGKYTPMDADDIVS